MRERECVTGLQERGVRERDRQEAVDVHNGEKGRESERESACESAWAFSSPTSAPLKPAY